MNNLTYYLAANSCSGYTSFFDDCAGSFRKIIVLKNITKKAKFLLFKEIKDILISSDIAFDTVMHCGTPDETDAIILKEFSTVIADEHLFIKDIPLYADIVDFSEHLNLDFEVQKNIDEVKRQISTIEKRMFSHLGEAKAIHDDWEKIYISNMDFDAIDEASKDLINNIFGSENKLNSSHSSKNYDRFFGTLLPRGNVNYINELTSDLKERIFIKGRPGTGKSTLLKKIISSAHQNGYNTETYYCSFDPNSLDMVIIRELDVAIFDSTSPHEIYPSREGDSIFDIYDIAVNQDTDEIYSEELMHITGKYNQAIKKAKECMYTNTILRQKYDEIITNDIIIDKSIKKVISLASLN